MSANDLIEFNPTHRGMLLELPRRRLGKAKKFGWLPLLLGLISLGFGVSCISSIFPLMLPGPTGFDFLDVFIIACATASLAPLWFGLKFIALGIAILRDQTYAQVEITNKNLICRESFHGFSFKRKIPAQPVKQLVINQMVDPPKRADNDHYIGSDSDHTSQPPDFLRQLFPDDLRVLTTSKKMGLGIIAAYPSKIVAEAASLIKTELDEIQFRLPSSRIAEAPNGPHPSVSNPSVQIIDATQEVDLKPSRYRNAPMIGSSESLEASSPEAPPNDSLLTVTHRDGTVLVGWQIKRLAQLQMEKPTFHQHSF